MYQGDLPDLFREGQGIVAQGSFGPDRVFHASQVLAKHDENYMPREVADRLKEKGEWRPEGETAPRESRPQAVSATEVRSSRPQAVSATEMRESEPQADSATESL